MMGDNVETVHFGGEPFKANGDFADDLYSFIMERAGRISLAEVIGVLRIVEHKLIDQHSA